MNNNRGGERTIYDESKPCSEYFFGQDFQYL